MTERTREIGVRKALGARQRDVLLQFLIESATMALTGGAIGVLCGVVVGKLITLVIGFPTSVPLWAFCWGLFVAAARASSSASIRPAKPPSWTRWWR